MEFYRKITSLNPDNIHFSLTYTTPTLDELDFIKKQHFVKWASIIGKKIYKPIVFIASIESSSSLTNSSRFSSKEGNSIGKIQIRLIWLTMHKNINHIVLHDLFKVGFWMLTASNVNYARIFYWDVLTKRTFPPHDHAISPINVNGGSSYKNSTESISIYRREEATKVLIHEFIHALGLDINIPESVDKSVELLTGIVDARLYEAYTEAIAEWLYMLYTKKLFWQKQLDYSRDRAYKLIKHFNGDWKETTAAFSYYVMKYILLTHFKEVIYSSDGAINMWPKWLIEFMNSNDNITTSRSTSLAMLAPGIASF